MRLLRLAGAVCIVLPALTAQPAAAAIQVETRLDWTTFRVDVFPLLPGVDPGFQWAGQSQIVAAWAFTYPDENGAGPGPMFETAWSAPLVVTRYTSRASAESAIEYDVGGHEILRAWAYSEPSGACPAKPCGSSNVADVPNRPQRDGFFSVSAPAAVMFSIDYVVSIDGSSAAPGEIGYGEVGLSTSFASSTGSGNATGYELRSWNWPSLGAEPPLWGTLYAGVFATGPGTGSMSVTASAYAESPVGVIPEPGAGLMFLTGITAVASVSARRARGPSPL